MDDIAKTLFYLVKSRHGYFKSEKQSIFLRSKFKDGTFVSSQSGPYDNGTLFVFHADEKGIHRVEKEMVKSKKKSLHFERSLTLEQSIEKERYGNFEKLLNSRERAWVDAASSLRNGGLLKFNEIRLDELESAVNESTVNLMQTMFKPGVTVAEVDTLARHHDKVDKAYKALLEESKAVNPQSLSELVKWINVALSPETEIERLASIVSWAERMRAYAEPAMLVLHHKNSNDEAKISIWLEGKWLSSDGVISDIRPAGLLCELKDVVKGVSSLRQFTLDEITKLKNTNNLYQNKIGLLFSGAVIHSFRNKNEAAINAIDSILINRMMEVHRRGIDVGELFYHETEVQRVVSIASEGFDLSKTEASSRDPLMPHGVFLKRTRETLDIATAPVQIPILLKYHIPDAVYRTKDRESFNEKVLKIPQYVELKNKLEEINTFFDEKCDVFVKAENTEENRRSFDEILKEWKTALHPLVDTLRKIVKGAMLNEGFSHLHMEQDAGSHGRKVEARLVFNADDVVLAPGAGKFSQVLLFDPPVKSLVSNIETLTTSLKEMEGSVLEVPQKCAQIAESTGLPYHLISDCVAGEDVVSVLVRDFHDNLDRHARDLLYPDRSVFHAEALESTPEFSTKRRL